MPWGPSRISLAKLMMATHTTGDTSTPKEGGTTLRVGARIHSVGKYTSSHGIFRPSVSGYQVVMIRMVISRVPTANTGPRTAEMVAAVSGLIWSAMV